MRFFTGPSWFATSLHFIVFLHGVIAHIPSIHIGTTQSYSRRDINAGITGPSSPDCGGTVETGRMASTVPATDGPTDFQTTPFPTNTLAYLSSSQLLLIIG